MHLQKIIELSLILSIGHMAQSSKMKNYNLVGIVCTSQCLSQVAMFLGFESLVKGSLAFDQPLSKCQIEYDVHSKCLRVPHLCICSILDMSSS